MLRTLSIVLCLCVASPVLADNSDEIKKLAKSQTSDAKKENTTQPESKGKEKKETIKKSESEKDYKEFKNLKLDYSKLSQWKNLSYRYEAKGGPSPKGLEHKGYWKFDTEFKGDKIITRDKREFFYKDSKNTDEVDVEIVEHLTAILNKDATLSPEKVKFVKDIVGSFEINEFTAVKKKDSEKGEMNLETDIKEVVTNKEIKWEADDMLAFTAYRMMSLLPRDKDQKYKLNYMYTMSVTNKYATYITCNGKKEFMGIDCTEFKLKIKGFEMTFYLDNKTGLIREIIDDKGTFRLRLMEANGKEVTLPKITNKKEETETKDKTSSKAKSKSAPNKRVSEVKPSEAARIVESDDGEIIIKDVE